MISPILDYYSVEGDLGGDGGWDQGFTHRYVGGPLRFLTFGHSSGLILLEFAPPANFGGVVSPANQWNDIWGGTFDETGCWIDGPKKHGFILVPSFSSGRAWYPTSTLNWDYRTSEIQIYDPSRFAEVLNGTRAVGDVKPASRWAFSLPAWFQLAEVATMPCL